MRILIDFAGRNSSFKKDMMMRWFCVRDFGKGNPKDFKG